MHNAADELASPIRWPISTDFSTSLNYGTKTILFSPARFFEKIRHRQIFISISRTEGSFSVVVSGIDIGPMGYQEIDNPLDSPSRSNMKRCISIIVFRIDI